MGWSVVRVSNKTKGQFDPVVDRGNYLLVLVGPLDLLFLNGVLEDDRWGVVLCFALGFEEAAAVALSTAAAAPFAFAVNGALLDFFFTEAPLGPLVAVFGWVACRSWSLRDLISD